MPLPPRLSLGAAGGATGEGTLSLSLSLTLSLTLTLTLALALTRWTPFSAIAYAISEAVTDGEDCASTARPWWGYVVEP